ncbi:MAG: hypothetical protein Q9199_003483 [Rusavskia elegans]
MGQMDKKTVFEGGSFIDAANTYLNEQSEMWIGGWLSSKSGLRDQMVVATKCGLGYETYKGFDSIIHAITTGNGTKSLNLSLEASLKKLKPRYIDIMFVHWWDFTTSIPKLMHSLNTVCDQGKVLYLGISDTPPGSSSTKAAGAPQTATSSGNFKTEEQRKAVAGKGRNMAPRREKDIKVSAALEKLAKAKNTTLTSVALAYVLHKAPYVFPIVGGRKIEHLQGNIDALSVELRPEDLAEIEGAVDFDPGCPLIFISPMAKGGAKFRRMSSLPICLASSIMWRDLSQFVLIRPAEPWTGSRGTLLGMYDWHFENMDSGGGLRFMSYLARIPRKKVSFRAVTDGFL